jgi:hypothetical protein
MTDQELLKKLNDNFKFDTSTYEYSRYSEELNGTFIVPVELALEDGEVVYSFNPYFLGDDENEYSIWNECISPVSPDTIWHWLETFSPVKKYKDWDATRQEIIDELVPPQSEDCSYTDSQLEEILRLCEFAFERGLDYGENFV